MDGHTSKTVRVEDDAVTVVTNGHFTSREMTTPRGGSISRGGASNRLVTSLEATKQTRRDRTRCTALRECRRCSSSVVAP